MADPTVLCTDGSDLSVRALEAGYAVVRPEGAVIIVTVIEAVDLTLLTGTGIAGGTMSPAGYDALSQQTDAEGAAVVKEVADLLAIEGAETRVLRGAPGAAVCQFAADVSAGAIVIGSRGRGGFKRALLGSVSDFVVRNAPCPVVITNPEGAEAPGPPERA